METAALDPTFATQLEHMSFTDKILFLIYTFGPMTFGQIQDFCMRTPGEIRSSTRTYHKKYTFLINNGLIVKKKTADEQYYTYNITANGEQSLISNGVPIQPIKSLVKPGFEPQNTYQTEPNENIAPPTPTMSPEIDWETNDDSPSDPIENLKADNTNPSKNMEGPQAQITKIQFNPQIEEYTIGKVEISVHQPTFEEIISMKSTRELVDLLIQGPSQEENDAIWQEMEHRSIDLNEKMGYIELLFDRYGLSVGLASTLLASFHISLRELYEVLWSIQNHETLFLTFFDVIFNNLIENETLGWKETIALVENQIRTKKGIILEYLAFALEHFDYSKAFRAFNILRKAKQITLNTAKSELEILLNAQQYNLLNERFIEYNLQSNPNLLEYRPYFDFIIFQTFMEQGKSNEMVNNPMIADKWQEIATLDLGLKNGGALKPMPEIIAKFTPEFRRNPSQNVLKYFLENMPFNPDLLFITPYVARWLHEVGLPDQAIELIRRWWDHSDKIRGYSGILKDGLQLLMEWDQAGRPFWNQQITEISQKVENLKKKLQETFEETLST